MPLFADNIRSAYTALAVAALIIAGLVLGRDVLLPLAVAACFAFVLSPIVAWIERRRIPRAAAIIIVAVATIGATVALSTLFISQAVTLAADLGTYRANLVTKIRAVTDTARSDGAIRRAADALLSLETELTREMKSPAQTGAASSDGQRVVVEVDTSRKTFWDHLGVFAQPLATGGLVVLFTLFLLLQTQDLRDRLVRVIGTDNVGGTTAAISDAADRLAGLFLTQAMMNLAFGIFIGTALWLIGVPNSVLWGGLAVVMRFVPYVGSFIAAIPPVLLAAAVDPGWGMALAALLLFVVAEPLMGHVVEPVVLGHKAGLSPFAMLLSASFWALVWGPVGLILAAPLTLTLVVLGRYVGGLEFLSVLLGDEPPLSAPERLYHRLLAGDALAAAQQLEQASEGRDLLHLADEIVLPAFRIAAKDLQRGQVDRDRLEVVRTTATEMTLAFDGPPSDDEIVDASAPRVLVLAARSDVDKAAAEFVAHAFNSEHEAVAATATKGTGLTAISAAAAAGPAPALVAIVTTAEADAQYLPLICRRARKAFPTSMVTVLDVASTMIAPETQKKLGDAIHCNSAVQVAEQVHYTKPEPGQQQHARAS